MRAGLWYFMLYCSLKPNKCSEWGKEITKFWREIFVFLILPHFGYYLGIDFNFVVGNGLPYELKKVSLESNN